MARQKTVYAPHADPHQLIYYWSFYFVHLCFLFFVSFFFLLVCLFILFDSGFVTTSLWKFISLIAPDRHWNQIEYFCKKCGNGGWWRSTRVFVLVCACRFFRLLIIVSVLYWLSFTCSVSSSFAVLLTLSILMSLKHCYVLKYDRNHCYCIAILSLISFQVGIQRWTNVVSTSIKSTLIRRCPTLPAGFQS